MDRVPTVRRALRWELDRLAGEIHRRQEKETDACLLLYARRVRLQVVFATGGAWAGVRELLR